MMATGGANESAVNWSFNTPKKWNLEAICSDNDYLHLTYDGKRIRWSNSFDLLKKFVKNVVKEPGKWTSPGGNSRRFISHTSDLSMTWYYGKQKTLSLQGRDGDNLREMLIKICEKTASPESVVGCVTCDDDRSLLANLPSDETVYNSVEHEVTAVSLNKSSTGSTDQTNCNCWCYNLSSVVAN